MPNKTLGTPITAENIVDVLEIQRVTSNTTQGLDSQQWDVVDRFLADEVETTIGEPENGPPAIKDKQEILTRWKGMYEAADRLVIHHVTSNERVFFDDTDSATVFAKGVIVLENTPAGEFAEQGGSLHAYRWVNYEFGVTRTENSWKVNKINVEYVWQEFNSLPGD